MTACTERRLPAPFNGRAGEGRKGVPAQRTAAHPRRSRA
jgi:hypothetical protein